MRKKRTWFIRNGIEYLLFLIILIYCACPSNNKPTNPESLPSQIITEFKLYESTSGARLYLVTAQKAYVYNDAQKIMVENPRVMFYYEDGSISSTLHAQRGYVDTKNSNLFAQDSVVVITRDSTILHTDSLIWSNQEQQITTDAWVRIDSRQGLIQGQGLISDAAMKKIEIKSSVTGKSEYEFK